MANRVVVKRKKTPRELTPILPHEKHTRPRHPSWKISELWKGETGEGRDCGWFKNSGDMHQTFSPSIRTNKNAASRRHSGTPFLSYDMQRWPQDQHQHQQASSR